MTESSNVKEISGNISPPKEKKAKKNKYDSKTILVIGGATVFVILLVFMLTNATSAGANENSIDISEITDRPDLKAQREKINKLEEDKEKKASKIKDEVFDLEAEIRRLRNQRKK